MNNYRTKGTSVPSGVAERALQTSICSRNRLNVNPLCPVCNLSIASASFKSCRFRGFLKLKVVWLTKTGKAYVTLFEALQYDFVNL